MRKTAKALSVRQPWAMLICAGFKDIENRNWKTNHRGALYVHAGKAFDWNALEWLKRIKGARELVVDYFGIKTEGFQQVITTHKDELGAVVGCVYLRGCLQCSGSMKLTKEEVIKKVKLLANENIIISENFEYKTSVCRNIPCQCRVCGHEWMSSHNALVSGLGCRKCTGSLKKTQKEVVANLKKGASKELKIDYSFKYQNVRAKNIKCTCKKCKKEWFDSYILLVRGRGCNFCRDFKRKKVKNELL